MDYQTGDIVITKKKHPCGSDEWEVLRVGADFRIKCMGCGHISAYPKADVKILKKIKEN